MFESSPPRLPLAKLEAEPRFDVPGFSNDEAVRLGEIALGVIREHAWNLAVRVVIRDDLVFQAKLGTAGPVTDPWLAAKAAVAVRFGEPSLLVKRRHDAEGTPFEERDDVDHDRLKAAGGSIPIFVRGETVGTITMSGEAEEIDHLAAREALSRFNGG